MLFETELERIHSHSLNRILTLIGISLTLFSLLIILITPSVANFEFSIYDAYPFIFWLALFAAIITGSGILLINGLLKEQCNYHWIFGIFIIVLADSILLFMPLIRGYLNYKNGDTLVHIGWMKDIIHTGYVSSSNIYPIDHILGVVLNFFTGLSFLEITMIIPVLFSLFFIISFYLLSTVIFSKPSERLFLLAIASVLILGINHMVFTPNFQANMLLPFYLYLLFKSNISNGNRIFSLLLVITCTLLVFFHPLITILIILIFLIWKIASWCQKKLDIIGTFNVNVNGLIFLMITLFLSWSTYLYLVTKTAEPIIGKITGSSESVSEFQNYSDLLSRVNVDITYLVRLILNTYGQSIVLGTLSLICFIYLLVKVIKNEKISNIQLFSSICFFIFFIASILMFFINSVFGFTRIFFCVLIFSIILISSTWFQMATDLKINIILTRIITLAILAAVIWFSMFNLYLSPITKSLNQQVSKSEYFGMNSFFQYRDESYQILEFGISQERMYDALYGREYPRINVGYIPLGYNGMPPNHFGYKSGSSLGAEYKETMYFLLTDQGKFYSAIMYPEFRQQWRFNPEDFERLNYDASVQKIYNNGNLVVRLIG